MKRFNFLVIQRFTIGETPLEVRDQFPEVFKEWEVLDSEGDRVCFAATEQFAVDNLAALLFDTIYDFEIVKGTSVKDYNDEGEQE